jgi:hypothetical protein
MKKPEIAQPELESTHPIRTRAIWGWQEALTSLFILLCILGAYLCFRG